MNSSGHIFFNNDKIPESNIQDIMANLFLKQKKKNIIGLQMIQDLLKKTRAKKILNVNPIPAWNVY